MNHCIWICRNCPKRLVIIRNDDNGRIKFYKCMGRDEYADYVRNCHESSAMKLLFALDSSSGRFLSPFEEFRDLFWRPLPYVERRKIRMGDVKFLKMFDEQIDQCEMFTEMQLARWNDETN